MWSVGGPKSILVAIQILFSSLLILVVDEFNRIQTENRVKRNVCCYCCLLSLLLLMVVAVYFNERETFSTRDVAVLLLCLILLCSYCILIWCSVYVAVGIFLFEFGV